MRRDPGKVSTHRGKIEHLFAMVLALMLSGRVGGT